MINIRIRSLQLIQNYTNKKIYQLSYKNMIALVEQSNLIKDT